MSRKKKGKKKRPLLLSRKKKVVQKKKKKNRKRCGEATTQLKATPAVSSYKECTHPMWVSIGTHKVLLCGGWDFRDHVKEYTEVIKGLDVFFGLDAYRWEDYELLQPRRYLNPFLESLRKRFFSLGPGELTNIMVVHIPDRGKDEDVFQMVRTLMQEDKKVGFGCVGGHGRTGWLAAKLIQYFEKCSGDEAVRRIRERFCKKCVESKAQADDLGCKDVSGSDSVKKASSFSYKDWEKTRSSYEWPPSVPAAKAADDFLLPSFAREANLLPALGSTQEEKDGTKRKKDERDDDLLIYYGD